jgi:hypothetical protein
VLAAFAAALVLGVLFVYRQLHTRDPLLDVGLFKQPAFSLGSLAISSAFFALFGLIFLTTQYLQIVQGRSAINTGLVMLPLAFGLVIGSGLSHRITVKLGTPRQLFAALTAVALVIATVALWQPDTPTWLLALFFFVGPLAMGNVMAPATAGVGSAMNDVNRQVAGALGVAVIASVSSSLYSSKVDVATAALPPGAAHTAADSVGGAAGVAAHLHAGAADTLTAAAHGAFTDAMGLALLIGTGVLVAAAVLVKRYLPDQRSSTATAAAVAEHERGTARLEAHTEHHIHALEAPETAR